MPAELPGRPASPFGDAGNQAASLAEFLQTVVGATGELPAAGGAQQQPDGMLNPADVKRADDAPCSSASSATGAGAPVKIEAVAAAAAANPRDQDGGGVGQFGSGSAPAAKRPRTLPLSDWTCRQCSSPTVNGIHTCEGQHDLAPAGDRQIMGNTCRQCLNPAWKEKHTCEKAQLNSTSAPVHGQIYTGSGRELQSRGSGKPMISGSGPAVHPEWLSTSPSAAAADSGRTHAADQTHSNAPNAPTLGDPGRLASQPSSAASR